MDDKYSNKDNTIFYKKVKHENKFYYGSRDNNRASKDYLKSKKYAKEKYKKIKDRFGTIVYVQIKI